MNKQGPIKQLLLSSSYWVLSKPLVYALGLETAFLLCNFAEAENLSKDGWFYQTIATVEEKTTLSRRKQDRSIEELEKLNILETEVRGVPAKRYFKINYDKVGEILFGQSEQTSMCETNKLVCAKRTTNKELNYKEPIIKNISPTKVEQEEEVNITKKEIDTIIAEWNKNALGEIGQIRAINRNTKRYKLLNARYKETSLEDVLEGIRNIPKSNFLQGNNDRGWTIDFDWYIEAGNFIKVLEGKYNDTKEDFPGRRSSVFTGEGY